MAPVIANAALYCTDSSFSQKKIYFDVGHR